MVLPTLEGDSRLTMRGAIVSKPYIRATLDAMARSGVRAEFDGRQARIPGGQRYRPGRLVVPGDASSAAYLWAAGAASHGPVRVEGVPFDRPQADLAILDILESMGAAIARDLAGASARSDGLVATEVDLTDSPDLYPLVGVLASMASGESRLGGAAHVVLKESDRRRATISLARGMGASVRSDGGGLLIRGTPHPRPLDLRGCADHRLVMSAAVAALSGSAPSTLGEADSVRKSYPAFWKDFRSIGARSRSVSP
jgi:3-phosphoshikimate 1-carboxyvinyltransferase